MSIDIIVAMMIIFISGVVSFLFGLYVAIYRVKHFAIKRASEWVYNIAPRYMMQDSEDNIKMSVEGLRAFQNYMVTIENEDKDRDK